MGSGQDGQTPRYVMSSPLQFFPKMKSRHKMEIEEWEDENGWLIHQEPEMHTTSDIPVTIIRVDCSQYQGGIDVP